MLKSDTLRRSKDHWEVDGIFAFCYKVSREANCGLLNQYIHLKIGTRFVVNSKHSQYLFLVFIQVMFESGYLTLFGKELGEDTCQARQAAQKALVLNALENFKEFDKIFPALVAGLPIHVFKSAYSAREVSVFCLP